jgi:NAD(P)-dependent dehydrogenase (short-subunit alcohol dehydrogenase family)
VQDVVDAVMFLESASFVTGEILHVDGGKVPVTDQDLEPPPETPP